MNKRKIKELIEILREENLDEIEWSGLFTRVRVVKRAPAAQAPQQSRPVPEPAAVTREAAATKGAEPAPESGADEFEKILSPMVGTFYRASNPEEPPYVEVGKRISKGEVVCIIEAMKLMNEIEAESDGVIRDVLVEDAQPVEYGQPLFSIETD